MSPLSCKGKVLAISLSPFARCVSAPRRYQNAVAIRFLGDRSMCFFVDLLPPHRSSSSSSSYGRCFCVSASLNDPPIFSRFYSGHDCGLIYFACARAKQPHVGFFPIYSLNLVITIIHRTNISYIKAILTRRKTNSFTPEHLYGR